MGCSLCNNGLLNTQAYSDNGLTGWSLAIWCSNTFQFLLHVNIICSVCFFVLKNVVVLVEQKLNFIGSTTTKCYLGCFKTHISMLCPRYKSVLRMIPTILISYVSTMCCTTHTTFITLLSLLKQKPLCNLMYSIYFDTVWCWKLFLVCILTSEFWHLFCTLPQIYGCVLASISGIQPVLSFHYSDIISRDQPLTFYLAFELCFFFKQRLCHVSGSNFIAMSEKYLLDIMSCMYCFKLLFAIAFIESDTHNGCKHLCLSWSFTWHKFWQYLGHSFVWYDYLAYILTYPSAFDLAFYLAKIRIFVHVIGILPDM